MSRQFATATTVALATIVFGGIRQANAENILQLYVEGSTYDGTTETWTKTFNPGEPLVVWAIGNISGGGGKGTIEDVKMAISYTDTTPNTKDLTIELEGTTTGGLGGFLDPSKPSNVTASSFTEIINGDKSELPQLFGGKELPSHDAFKVGVEWQEFLLGDFTLTDSPIADFVNNFPTPNSPNAGQINAYIVHVTSALTAPISLHFDLYNHVQSGTAGKAVNAPFSHDAGGTGDPPPVVPEPGTFVLLALGGAGLAAMRRRRKPVEV